MLQGPTRRGQVSALLKELLPRPSVNPPWPQGADRSKSTQPQREREKRDTDREREKRDANRERRERHKEREEKHTVLIARVGLIMRA